MDLQTGVQRLWSNLLLIGLFEYYIYQYYTDKSANKIANYWVLVFLQLDLKDTWSLKTRHYFRYTLKTLVATWSLLLSTVILYRRQPKNINSISNQITPWSSLVPYCYSFNNFAYIAVIVKIRKFLLLIKNSRANEAMRNLPQTISV